MGNDIEGLLERVRCGTTTIEDAETIIAMMASYENRIHDLEAANRAYYRRYDEPPELPELEPA